VLGGGVVVVAVLVVVLVEVLVLVARMERGVARWRVWAGGGARHCHQRGHALPPVTVGCQSQLGSTAPPHWSA